MKPILSISTLCLSLLLVTGIALATPVDLSTFTADPGVTEAAGIITFIEQSGFSAIYFYNDAFGVDPLAGLLSFNYSLTASDPDQDFLVAIRDYTNYEFELGISGTGSFQIDLSSFRGQTISLAFGLESSDQVADSRATISNLDLATSATPIPEPGTLILLGSGLAGLLGIGRKKVTGFFK